MDEHTEEIADTGALRQRLIELSADGQCWAYSVMPFSHTTQFVAFASPSRVPDQYVDLMPRNRLGYKGRLVDFSPAAIVRAQIRGTTAD